LKKYKQRQKSQESGILIRVLSSGCAMSYYMLDAKLFLLPQHIPHREHSITHNVTHSHQGWTHMHIVYTEILTYKRYTLWLHIIHWWCWNGGMHHTRTSVLVWCHFTVRLLGFQAVMLHASLFYFWWLPHQLTNPAGSQQMSNNKNSSHDKTAYIITYVGHDTFRAITSVMHKVQVIWNVTLHHWASSSPRLKGSRHCDAPWCYKLPAQWHSVTCHKAWIFNNNAVRTSNFASTVKPLFKELLWD
jgi:hypothetical protein